MFVGAQSFVRCTIIYTHYFRCQALFDALGRYRYNTLATTLTEMAIMMTLKKNDTTLCSITSRRNGDDVIATSDVWQHMLSTTAKYMKSR